MHSWQFYSLKFLTKALSVIYRPSALNVTKIRKLFERCTQPLKICPHVKIEPVFDSPVPTEWIRINDDVRTTPVVLYFHGGGYIMGSLQSYRSYLSWFAHITQTNLLSVGYRLAPENPFPTALEDCLKVYDWLLKTCDRSRVILAGESAGGGLVLSTLMALRDTGKPLPQGAVCISPWTDLALTGESLEKNRGRDPLMPPDVFPKVTSLYLSDEDPCSPLASPLYGNFQGLPDIFVQASRHEVLFSDAFRLKSKASESKARMILDIWNDMFHAWPFFAAFLPEAKESLRRVADFIRTVTQ